MTFLSLREALIKAIRITFFARTAWLLVIPLHPGYITVSITLRKETRILNATETSLNQKWAESTVLFLSFPKHRDNRLKKKIKEKLF